jgi:Spy/CpxP family protein refolding chaperone
MRKPIAGIAILCLAIFVSTSLIGAEQEMEVEKDENSQAETGAMKCNKAMTCHKAGLTDKEASVPCCTKAQVCHSAQGCRSMMSPMRMSPMMSHMEMGRGMKESMPVQKGHGMVRKLHRLGSPALFIQQAEELNLSDEQMDKLNDLKWDQQKAAIEQGSRIQVARVELDELLGQKDVDFGKVKAKLNQISDLEKELGLARLNTIQKSRQILTPEQLEKSSTMKKHRSCGSQKSPKHIVKEIIIEDTTQ